MTPEISLPLFVGVPLLSAAFAVLSPWKWLRDALHITIPAAGVLAGVWLYVQTLELGTIAHVIGLYPGGAGITYAADEFSAIMIIASMIVALTANWFATAAGETEARFYPALTLILITGANGAFLTADLFNFFVMIEVMLLPSYGLIAMTGTRSRLKAGRLFVLVNLAASTLLVLGVGLVYGVTGTVTLAALEGAAAGNGPAVVALGVVIIAIAVKAGLFPVHTWLPQTYPSTSAAVMGIFSGIHTKVAVYMLMRLYVVVFDLDTRWTWLIIVVMVVSMMVGAFAGLAETSIRRVLAYQMVNGMPFILVMLAFAADSPRLAISAAILYTLHHMITMGALILNSGAIEETYGTDLHDRLAGLMRREPWTAVVFAAGAFSVVGFPVFSGMWGKVALVVAAASTGDIRSIVVITAIIVASVGAMLSMLRVWRTVFWGQDMQNYGPDVKIRWSVLAPSALMVTISVAMFIFAGPLLGTVHHATDGLLDVTAYSDAVLGDDPVGVPDMTGLQGGN